ncbi:SusC/RagA family TonB-linked outer membrane protein [Chitinophaga lutea]
MKMLSVLMLAAVMQVSASTYAQTVTISGQQMPLRKLFKEIRKQTGYDFVYSSAVLSESATVDLEVKNAPLEDVLRLCFRDQPLTWAIVDKTIVVKRRMAAAPVTPVAPVVQDGRVTGKVLDAGGRPIAGASVVVRGLPGGTTTNAQGEFSLIIRQEEVVLAISFVGYDPQLVRVRSGQQLTVRLQERTEQIKEVVISTGIFTRKKESFTGAIASVSGDQLRSVGNQNIVQSLKTLDPSFLVLENNLQGANPNTLPTIELRGKTSLTTNALQDQFGTDPNQPLFILDGFETTLRVINDLDINRVASITLLKDAASTALYGAKAANGVVVVETKKPVPGELRVSYTGDFRAEIPDLRSYNLMNAAEKLEFERLSRRYIPSGNSPDYEYQKVLDAQYYAKLAEVQRGVNTYWLREPIQTGFTNGHSVQVSGGSRELLFVAGANYKNISGAMKGSGRDMWGANMDLTYRKGKLNITNRLYLSGYKAKESPYGSFANFAGANPYYRMYNEDGSIPKYLERSTGVYETQQYVVANPLYNALLNSKNQTDNFAFQNALQMIYSITPQLQLQGSMQIAQGTVDTVRFSPPEHSEFDNAAVYERGRYSRGTIRNSGYQGNVMLTYARVFASRHQLTSNLRAEIQEARNRYERMVAVGFPTGTNGNPAFAKSYEPYGRPGAGFTIYRRTNLLASVNYSYDQRYLLDATYRLDGSTAFGSANKYSPFWSAGVGWNLHNEGFLKDEAWIDQLKLRANIGVTGNQNLGSVSSISVYNFENGQNLFGQGLSLTTLGNPWLEWQKTVQSSAGADIVLLRNRFSATLNVYEKNTDPLVIGVTMPSSTGIQTFPLNVGRLSMKGMEFNIRYAPIYNLKDRIIWTIGGFGSMVKGTYGGFGNALEGLNKTQLDSKSLIRFRDGFSPDDIWAVQSLGIDPGTGNELFLTREGLTTFTYDAADIRRVGNTRPQIEGIANTQLTIKGFSLGVNLRYRWGGDVFNSALYNKVENIGVDQLRSNQDRRALYDRWQNPGDVAKFKSISITTTTPMSSRFVQKDNNLVGESINVGWQFLADSWIRHLSMKSLRVTAFMNDIFRASTVHTERGIDYPFANTVSMSLNASF